MADLTPGELARIDQIHSAVMGKLAELISSAIDGIRQEGEAVTASKLAGTAQATDHSSVCALLTASLIRNARYAMADEKRKTDRAELVALLAEYADDEPCWLDHHGYCQNHRLYDTTNGPCINVRVNQIVAAATQPEATP